MSAKKRLKAMPVFTGTTAWELLDFITWVIQGEPKRYDQGAWIKLVEQGYSEEYKASQMPACGTIGCVAGWVDLLVTGRQTIIDVDMFADQTQKRATRILGLNKAQQNQLFEGNAIAKVREWLPVSLDNEGFYPMTGTEAYAALGVLHIRKFMQRHERKLKGTIVRPVAA